MFSDPNLFAKISENPSTKHFLKDPGFMGKLHSVQANPGLLQQEIGHEKRLMVVLEILLGINLSANGPGELGEPVRRHPSVLY